MAPEPPRPSAGCRRWLRRIAPLLCVALLSGLSDSAAALRFSADLSLAPRQTVAGLTRGIVERARCTSRDLGDVLTELCGVPAAHAAELGEGPEVPEPPNAVKRLWNSVKDKPLIRRVRTVASWIVAAARFLWAIPKALIQGDSEGLIEALGGILAQASADDTGTVAPLVTTPLAPESAGRSAAPIEDPDSGRSVAGP